MFLFLKLVGPSFTKFNPVACVRAHVFGFLKDTTTDKQRKSQHLKEPVNYMAALWSKLDIWASFESLLLIEIDICVIFTLAI